MTCANCGRGDERLLHVTRSYGQGADLLVIESVPIISCPHCGESYLTAETMHPLERIKQERKHFAVARRVEAASFATNV